MPDDNSANLIDIQIQLSPRDSAGQATVVSAGAPAPRASYGQQLVAPGPGQGPTIIQIPANQQPPVGAIPVQALSPRQVITAPPPGGPIQVQQITVQQIPPPSAPQAPAPRIAEVGGSDIPLAYHHGHDIELGLSWDYNPGIDQPVDLDCSVLCFNSGGTLLDACYYNNPVAVGGSLKHSGDNKDGRKQGFDESIIIDLDAITGYSDSQSQVPNTDGGGLVEILVFIVNAYKGGTLQDVQNATATFLEAPLLSHGTGQLGIPLASCPVTFQKRPFEGVILGLIYREKGVQIDPTNGVQTQGYVWKLRNVGRMIQTGRNFQECLGEVKSALGSSGILDQSKVGRILGFEKKFDMKKNDFLEIPADLFRSGSDLYIGLGWEANNPRGVLDLDASILLLDAKGNKIDCINFANRGFLNGVIQHQGDNQTGHGKGDDEKIDIDLDHIPPSVYSMFVVVNVYNSWGTFHDVRDAYVRLVASKNHHEFCRYKLEGLLPGAPCLVFCKIFRSIIPGAWLFQTIGVGCQGRVATENIVLQGCWASEQITASHFGGQQLEHVNTQMFKNVGLVQPQPVSARGGGGGSPRSPRTQTHGEPAPVRQVVREVHSNDKCCCTIT